MSRQSLKVRGFRGFVPFSRLTVSDVPGVAGVYVIVRTSAAPPTFLSGSPAGHFKGREPSVSIEELTDAWVDGAEVIYIGKAGAGQDGRRGLRKRLDEYRRYGAGEPVGHQGGRYIWQLQDASSLLVAWLPTSPDQDPGDVEASLVAEFTKIHGSRPFANRNSGRRPRT